MLLIHGVIVDAAFYERAAVLLSKHFRVITYDRRGNSRSRLKENDIGNAEPFSMDRQAEDIRDLMDHLDIDHAYIAGASAGAAIGQYFLQKYPERTDHLIMFEPAMLGLLIREDEDTSRWTDKVKELVSRRKYSSALLMFSESVGTPDGRSPEKPEEVFVREMDNVQFAFDNELKGLIAHIPDIQNMKEHRDRITIAAGERSADTRYGKLAGKLAKETGNKLVYFPGGHNLPYDLPEEFAICLIGTLKLRAE